MEGLAPLIRQLHTIWNRRVGSSFPSYPHSSCILTIFINTMKRMEIGRSSWAPATHANSSSKVRHGRFTVKLISWFNGSLCRVHLLYYTRVSNPWRTEAILLRNVLYFYCVSIRLLLCFISLFGGPVSVCLCLTVCISISYASGWTSDLSIWISIRVFSLTLTLLCNRRIMGIWYLVLFLGRWCTVRPGLGERFREQFGGFLFVMGF